MGLAFGTEFWAELCPHKYSDVEVQTPSTYLRMQQYLETGSFERQLNENEVVGVGHDPARLVPLEGVWTLAHTQRNNHMKSANYKPRIEA